MTKRGRDFLEIFAGLFSDGGLLPFVPIIWILIVGTAVWAIDPERFEYLFPGAVFISGLLIVLGESLFKWLSHKRK